VAAPLSVEISFTCAEWSGEDEDFVGQTQGLISLSVQELSGWETLLLKFDDAKETRMEESGDTTNPISPLGFLRPPMPSLRRL